MSADVIDDFYLEFSKELARCFETGDPAKIILCGPLGSSVTVEIYQSKGTTKKLNDAILAAVKASSGISITKEFTP